MATLSHIKKIYYSIGEVSQITGVKPKVLRTWETEFPELRPGKNRAGKRVYRLNDIKTIFAIKRLVVHEKYTVEGARLKLRAMKQARDSQFELPLHELRKQDLVREIRHDLLALLDYLDSGTGDGAPA